MSFETDLTSYIKGVGVRPSATTVGQAFSLLDAEVLLGHDVDLKLISAVNAFLDADPVTYPLRLEPYLTSWRFITRKAP